METKAFTIFNTRMNHRYLNTIPQLADYIQTILVIDGCTDSGGSDLPLFTNGMPGLLCEIAGGEHSVTLFGQSVPAEKWIITNDTLLIAYFFKPFALGTIFKLAAAGWKEKSLPLNRWKPQKAMALTMQLLHTETANEKLAVLDQFILSQLQVNRRDCDIIRYATDKLMQDPSADILQHLLQELHLTEKTFQRIFKKYVGITPNEYRRTCQFYFAFSQLKGGHYDKLADVAYDNGYFDQSHYIRSFKEFTDTTPNSYLRSGLGKPGG